MKKSILNSLIFSSLFFSSPLWGQTIIPDHNSNSTNTIINNQGNSFNITGGTLSSDGANLFHSFQEFNLTSQQIANFISNPNINNILGRITGGNVSIVDGLIQVTGGNSNLYLMNPAGLIFGSNFTLNVPADFTATTATGMGFGEHWFNAFGENNYNNLTGDPSSFAFNLANNGVIINNGNIELNPEHNINLIGGTVINTGTIKTPEGNINISAVEGSKIVKISQEGSLLSLELDLENSNLNLGEITPLQLPELLTGRGVNTGLEVTENQTVNLLNSNIALPNNNGTSIIAGQLEVSGSQGGNITILGDTVGLVNARVRADGLLGDGGTILIGGDFQGGGSLPTAQLTAISTDSLITANAGATGNGGTVVIWSDGLTNFYGNIEAKGGTIAGDGGMVEVSGENYLVFRGMVDASAINGEAGTLLLDPKNITIKDVFNVAVFTNSSFIDVSGGSGSEGLTIQSSLTQLGYTITTFTGYTATDFANAAASANIILIPEQEVVELNSALDPTARSQLATLINNGTGFIINGTPGTDNYISLLNNVFGYNLISQDPTSSTSSLIVSNAAGTPFATGTSSLSPNSAISYVSNLPSGALNLYSLDGGATSTVFASNYGAGRIVYLGWDWFEASPLGTQDGGWLEVLDRSVQFTQFGNLSDNQLFSQNPSASVTITPTQITNITNTGTALTLQANNDITVNSAIITNNPSGNGGALTLQAGRSILLNANIVTDNGNLNLLANNNSANLTYRDAGPSNITMAAGTSINTGTGNLNISMGTLSPIGTIDLRTIISNGINITGNEINFNAGAGTVTGNTITLAPVSTTQNLNLGFASDLGATSLDLTATDLAALSTGFTNITINNSANNGIVTLNSTGVTFNAPVNIAGGTTLGGTNNNTTWTLTGANQGSLSGFPNGLTFANIENLTGGSGNDDFVFNGGNLTGAINGGSGTNTLQGDDDGNDFTITGTDSGTLTGKTSGWSQIQNLTGGIGDDNFVISGGNLTGNINGQGGNNTLTGDNVANIFTVTGVNSGTATGIGGTFSNIQNLIGNAQNDSFTLSGGSLSGFIDGQGNYDTLYGDNIPSIFTITGLNVGTSTNITGGFSNIENLVGGTDNDTLIGNEQNNIFTITGLNLGNVDGNIDFSGIENLFGGDGDDSFILSGGILTGNIDGQIGNNTLTGDNVVNTFTIIGLDNGTVTGVGGSFTNIQNLIGGSNTDSFIFSGGTLTGNIDGQGANNTITGGNVENTFTITGLNSGTFSGIGGSFTNIQNLIGGGNTDSFILSGGTLSGNIDGGAGNNTLTGANVANTFTVTGLNSGTVTGLGGTFTNIQNLTGGGNTDSFVLSGGTLSGNIDGGAGNNTFTGANVANTFSITGVNNGTVTGVGGSFTNIQNLIGGTNTDSFILRGGSLTGNIDGKEGNNTLQGADTVNIFTLTGLNTGTVTGVTGIFTNIQNLIGGTNTDTFQFIGGTLTGNIDGNQGDDTIIGDNGVNTFTVTGANTGTVTGLGGIFSNIENLTGNVQSDSFSLVNGGTLSGIIDGKDGDDTLTGDNVENIFTITGLNSGTMTGIGSFINIENLIGNTLSDAFVFVDGGSLTGNMDGKEGIDHLDFSSYSAPVTITLTAPDQGFVNPTFVSIENFFGGLGDDTFVLQGGTVSGIIDGQGGNNTLVGDNVPNLFEVTGVNRGTAPGVTGGFTNIQNLTGNNQDDTFALKGGSLTGRIDGGGGNNTFIGDNGSNTFTISDLNSGKATGIGSFINIQNLIGGDQDDRFVFVGNGRLDGRIDGGGGTNILDYFASRLAGVVKITGDGTITGSSGIEELTIGGGFDNIETILGADVKLLLNDTNSLTWALAEAKISSTGGLQDGAGAASGDSSDGGGDSSDDSGSVGNMMGGANFASYCHASLLGSFEGENLAGIRKFERQLNGQIASRYAGNRNMSCQGGVNSQDRLKQIESITGIRGAIVYLRFVPEFEIISENDFIWELNKSLGKSGNKNGSKNQEDNLDQLEITVLMPSGQVIQQKIPSATRENVRNLVTRFLAAVTDPRRKTAYVNPSSQLYNLIIKPIEADLVADGINNLSFVVDSELRSLSMAALYDETNQQFLVEKFSLGMMPSFSMTNTEYFDLRQTPILAMGSERFENENNEQSPLPAVPFELSLITDQIWQGEGDSFLNENFTIGNLQKLREGLIPYGIVHLATHGEFRPGSLDNSYIQFWDEKLTLDKLELLKLNNPPVDLLVLSACRTAVGDKDAELGFAGLAIAAGVKSTLGSLWYVSDQGTLALMTTFYRQLRLAPIKAEALRQAQLAMIKGTTRYENRQLFVNLEGIPLSGELANQAAPDLSHPYYWSAFSLVGSPW